MGDNLDTLLNSSALLNFSGELASCLGANNTSGCANVTDSMGPPYTVWQIALIASLAGTLSLVTIVGNLIVILSFILERTIRQPTNYYIASLAVSDLLIGIISMPFFTVYLLQGEIWPLGEILCDLWLSIDYTVCLTSIYTVFCITIDRFCSVKIPAKYRNWRTERKVLVIIAITWIVPTLLFFTSIFGWQYFVGVRTVKTKEKGECRIQYMDNSIFNCVLQISYFWVTLIVMCSLYGGIYKVALDLHKKSQAKKNKMTSLVSMAGQTMTKIGIGMSQQQNINTNKLFPPQKSGKSETPKQRPRGPSTTSFSSTRGDRDERSSSPAFPSDTDPDSNSPSNHPDPQREKRVVKKKNSSKSPKKLKNGPAKSKSHPGKHKDSLKQSLMPEATLDKSFTTETTGLLTQLHNSSGSTATNSTSGFVSNTSNASSTINTNAAHEDKLLPLHRNSLLMADAYHQTQPTHKISELNDQNQLRPTTLDEECTKSKADTQGILQGAKYIDSNFLKALQSSDRLKLMSEFDGEMEIIPTETEAENEALLYCKTNKDLSPVWKRKSWLEEQQVNDKADKSNRENAQDPFSVNDNVNGSSGTVDGNSSKSSNAVPLQMYSNGSLNKLNSAKQDAVNQQQATTRNPHQANGNPLSLCEQTNHELLIHSNEQEAGETGASPGSNPGWSLSNANTAEAENPGIPTQVSESCITADNDVRQCNPSLCSSSAGLDDCSEAPLQFPQETQPAIAAEPAGNGNCGLLSMGLSLAGTGQSVGGGGEGDNDSSSLHRNLPAALVQGSNGCKTGCLAGGKISEEEKDCSNNNSMAAAAAAEVSGEGGPAIKGQNLLSPARYRHLKSTGSDDSINNDQPSSSTSKASDYLGETSNDGAHSPNADDVVFAPHKSPKKGASGSGKNTSKRRKRKTNNAGRHSGNSSQFRNFMKSSRRKERSKAEKQKSKSENRARKALRTITIILGAFVLCWTPWHVFSMLMGFSVKIPLVLYNISYWLCYLNSPVNPLCYAFANQQFKKTFIRIMKLDWHRT